MLNNRKFSDLNDNINFELVEEWCEEYFQNTLGMLNAFFAKLAPAEVIERLKTVPFADMAVEQLEDEIDEVREYAIRKMNALAASELEYYEAYVKLGEK